MRFGISLISWMLPKILRIRRAAVLRPVLFLAGASIALVAMVFPALMRMREVARAPLVSSPVLGREPVSWSADPVCSSPMRSIRAPFGPCPGEDGKSPGRTSPCGGAVYLLDWADIGFFRAGARPRRE